VKATRTKNEHPWRVTARIEKNDALLMQLGHMCVAWASLEYVLFQLFYHLTGLPTSVVRSMFYAQNTSFAKISLLHATYTPLLTKKYRPLAAGRKLKKFLDGLGALANHRNGFIHDVWAHKQIDKRLIAQFVLKTKGAHGQIRRVRARDIVALTKRIETAGRRAIKLTRQLSPQFAASRERLLRDRDLTLLFANSPPPQSRKTKKPRSRAVTSHP